jgi:hypothetical protein
LVMVSNFVIADCSAPGPLPTTSGATHSLRDEPSSISPPAGVDSGRSIVTPVGSDERANGPATGVPAVVGRDTADAETAPSPPTSPIDATVTPSTVFSDAVFLFICRRLILDIVPNVGWGTPTDFGERGEAKSLG